MSINLNEVLVGLSGSNWPAPASHWPTLLNSAGDGSSVETPRWERLACWPTHSRATVSHRNKAWTDRSNLWAVLRRCSLAVIPSSCELRMSQQRATITRCSIEPAVWANIWSLHFEPKSSCWKLVCCTSQRAISKHELIFRYEEILDFLSSASYFSTLWALSCSYLHCWTLEEFYFASLRIR